MRSGSHAPPASHALCRGGASSNPTSKASQDAKSKGALQTMKSESANSLHALLRLMARDDIRFSVRMIQLAVGPFAQDSAKVQREVKCSSSTRAQFAEWAHWSWLEALKLCARSGTDFKELVRCGVVMQSSIAKAKRGDMQDQEAAELAAQDDIYNMYWRLVFHLLREHSTSYAHFSCSFPCAAAGTLHKDPALRSESVRYFQAHVCAFESASGWKTPGVSALIEKHPLRSTSMRFFTKFMQASGYNASSVQVQEWLRQMFEGQLGTVMIEQSAKCLRESETRDTNSKMMQHMRAWEVLLQSKLMADHGRQEISLAQAPSPPATFNERLFVPTRAQGEQKSKLDLDGILKTQTWVSYSAQSQKANYGNMEVLRVLDSMGKFDRAEDTWHTKLLPEGTLIKKQETGDGFLVLQVLGHAALCWPLSQIAADTWGLDLDVKKLEWVVILATDSVQAPDVLTSSGLGHLPSEHGGGRMADM